MIVSAHVATGAAVGWLAGSRSRVAVLAPLAHLVGDAIPHWDLRSRRFEIVSGVALGLAVAARHGPTSAPTLGALLASAPDLEHVLRLPRPRGRKLFPSHRYPALHKPGGVSTSAQLLLAGVVTGAVLAQRPRRPG